jgi:Helix-turn-helix domain
MRTNALKDTSTNHTRNGALGDLPSDGEQSGFRPASVPVAQFAKPQLDTLQTHPQEGSRFKPKRLLDVSEIAEWLGVSNGWVRDHASGRRHPRLPAVKLGPSRGKGLWKFREEDVQQFILELRHR